MKRLSLFCLVTLVIVGMSWIAGCRSPQAPAGDTVDLMNRAENPNLNDPYGGYNMRDEAPGFGDPALVEEFGEGSVQNVDDPFANHPDVNRAGADRVFLMITWGNLHRDSSLTHVTLWAGSLTVHPGMVVLKQVIRFEPNDRIIPRVSRDLLEWEYTTRGGIDGILVRVVPTPSTVDSMIDSSATVIRFATDPLKVEFTLDELPGLQRVINLPDGNAVAFTAVRPPPAGCPHGFLHGAWMNHPERPGGMFHGRWGTADGKVRGFLKGIYGVNDNGERVFFGKMISFNGRFEGIMRGRWGPAPGIDNGGFFAGHWVDRNLQIRGGLRGMWQRSPHCNGGFFRGEWAMECNP